MEIIDKASAAAFCAAWANESELRQIRHLTFAIESQEKRAKRLRIQGRAYEEFAALEAISVLLQRRLALRMRVA